MTFLTIFRYLLIGFALLGFFCYVHYRGWKRGIICAKKRLHEHIEESLCKSKELIIEAKVDVKKAMEEVERIQLLLNELRETKDKKIKTKIKHDLNESPLSPSDIQEMYRRLEAQQLQGDRLARLGMSAAPLHSQFSELLGDIWPPHPYRKR